MTTHQNPKNFSDRFLTTLTLSVLLGFGAGAVGTLVAAVYFYPAPVTVSVTQVPRATLSVNRVESKRLTSPASVSRAVVDLFEAKTAAPLAAVYLGPEAVGAGMTLTSDGWIIAQAGSMKTTKKGAALVAKVDGRLYAVSRTVTDRYSGAVFFKVEARDLPVVTMAKTAAGFTPGDSLFAIDLLGGVRRLEVVNMAATTAESAADLIRSSEQLTRFMMVGPQPSLPIGTMVLDDKAEAVGLVASHGKLGTLIAPVEAWRDVIDSVLKGQGTVRPYFGAHYLDLAESGIVDAAGYAARGAKLATSADGKTPAVEKGSPADKAGLRAGDVILTVNGEPVSERKTLSAIMAAYIPGMSVTVSYQREGMDRKADVALVAAPSIDKKP